MTETTFWFTEYKIEGTLTTLSDFDSSLSRSDRERQAIIDYIQSKDPVVETSSSKWYFGAVDPGPEIAIGKFGKEYTDEQGKYDEEEGDFIEKAGRSTDIDYSMFVINFEKGILIYNTKGRIGHEQFRTRFAEGLKIHHNGVVSMKTEFIKNEQTLEEIIETADVYSADLELEPSNPSSDPEWEELDESIQNMLADELRIVAESDRDLSDTSLNMDEDLLKQAVKMAQTKYGLNYRLVYNDDGVVKAVTKDRDPVTRKQEQPDNLPSLRQRASGLLTIASSYLK